MFLVKCPGCVFKQIGATSYDFFDKNGQREPVGPTPKIYFKSYIY
jgi:hypothetical protein